MNRKRLFPSELDLHASAVAAMTAVKNKVEVAKLEEVPRDFFSRKEIEKLWNLSASHTGKRISEAIESGLLEKKDFRVLEGSIVKPRPHYRVIT
jgi:Fic family protein